MLDGVFILNNTTDLYKEAPLPKLDRKELHLPLSLTTFTVRSPGPELLATALGCDVEDINLCR